jgi:hypothetical protein
VALVSVAALVALGPAGCDGSRTGAADGRPARECPSSNSTQNGAADRDDPDPATTASGEPLAPVSFGQPSSTVGAGFDLEFTVYGYKQPAGSACPDPDHPDHEWAAVDVEVCAKSLPDGFEYVVGWSPWSLASADGTTAHISTFLFPEFEQPQYPDGRILPLGECQRGWITFSVPKGKRPATVLYQPVGERHAWTVPPRS